MGRKIDGRMPGGNLEGNKRYDNSKDEVKAVADLLVEHPGMTLKEAAKQEVAPYWAYNRTMKKIRQRVNDFTGNTSITTEDIAYLLMYNVIISDDAKVRGQDLKTLMIASIKAKEKVSGGKVDGNSIKELRAQLDDLEKEAGSDA